MIKSLFSYESQALCDPETIMVRAFELSERYGSHFFQCHNLHSQIPTLVCSLSPSVVFPNSRVHRLKRYAKPADMGVELHLLTQLSVLHAFSHTCKQSQHVHKLGVVRIQSGSGGFKWDRVPDMNAYKLCMSNYALLLQSSLSYGSLQIAANPRLWFVHIA